MDQIKSQKSNQELCLICLRTVYYINHAIDYQKLDECTEVRKYQQRVYQPKQHKMEHHLQQKDQSSHQDTCKQKLMRKKLIKLTQKARETEE